MAHGFLRLMILELLRGNLHSTLQLWEMKMPSCLEAVIRKWAWNGIVLSWAWANLFLTIKLFRMEMFMKHDPPTMKQVLFFRGSKFKYFFPWEQLSNHCPDASHFWKFLLHSFPVSVLNAGWPFRMREGRCLQFEGMQVERGVTSRSRTWLQECMGHSSHPALCYLCIHPLRTHPLSV